MPKRTSGAAEERRRVLAGVMDEARWPKGYSEGFVYVGDPTLTVFSLTAFACRYLGRCPG